MCDFVESQVPAEREILVDHHPYSHHKLNVTDCGALRWYVYHFVIAPIALVDYYIVYFVAEVGNAVTQSGVNRIVGIGVVKEVVVYTYLEERR